MYCNYETQGINSLCTDGHPHLCNNIHNFNLQILVCIKLYLIFDSIFDLFGWSHSLFILQCLLILFFPSFLLHALELKSMWLFTIKIKYRVRRHRVSLVNMGV